MTNLPVDYIKALCKTDDYCIGLMFWKDGRATA